MATYASTFVFLSTVFDPILLEFFLSVHKDLLCIKQLVLPRFCSFTNAAMDVRLGSSLSVTYNIVFRRTMWASPLISPNVLNPDSFLGDKFQIHRRPNAILNEYTPNFRQWSPFLLSILWYFIVLTKTCSWLFFESCRTRRLDSSHRPLLYLCKQVLEEILKEHNDFAKCTGIYVFDYSLKK